MSRGMEFLTEVTGKLKQSIQSLDEKILAGQKDIEGMNEYYWENYTEMDQYGYENFDNQQALRMQVNANVQNRRYRQRLQRMLDAPFFGSVDFVYEGEEDAETFYIGIGNFAEQRGRVPLIYDWRAPVSGLFYDYDRGEASYEAPGGRMDGEITSKWQYKIRRGQMVYEFESDIKIDDEILKQELGANGDVQLKNIVRTIQKEQNAIIRNTKDQVLAIQGAAGSGKTSVALHRIAYLLYHDRKSLRSSNVLILSPNGVFSDYISHILPELGEEHIQEMSFDLFAYRKLRGTVADCEDRYHQIERRIHGVRPEEEARYQWKQSKEYVRAAEGFLVDLEDRLVDFRDISYRGTELRAEEILKLFYFEFTETPLLSRMDEVADYFIDSYETLHGKTLQEDETAAVRSRFQAMYRTTDLYEIYSWLLEDCGWPALPELEPERRVLQYEDVFPMLYLKQRLLRGEEHRQIRHLIIDEMQDYSYLQYVILQQMFSCRMTILGDRAQTMDEEAHDVLAFLPEIFGKKMRCIKMNRSYRNTLEIAGYAASILEIKGIELFQRHGKPVEELCVSSQEELVREIQKRVKPEQFETAAVLAMTEQEASALWAALREAGTEAHYIDRDTSQFRKGLTVTTYYLAKGLEFDQVFVAGGDETRPFYRQFCYISATRALHELYCFRISGS